MGKSPKPLKILITDPELGRWGELTALVKQGHTIDLFPGDTNRDEYDLPVYDLILGPNCWRMDNTLRSFLDLAIKEARARAYPKPDRYTPIGP